MTDRSEYMRAYYAANRATIRAQQSAYKAANRERVNARKRVYRQENGHAVKIAETLGLPMARAKEMVAEMRP